MLKRKTYDQLCKWKKESNGRTAILINGARRVGKSFIAQEFGKNEYKSCLTIDFSNVSKDVVDVFENDIMDFNLFFQKLSFLFDTKLYQRDSLIIFDEVQQFPKARQLIKHLVADGRYDYLETGSLIRLKKNVQDIVIPSEEEQLDMFPLDFEEFLWALGNDATIPILQQFFEERRPLGAVHRHLLTLFRQYVLVGGMPQSVLAYIKNADFAASDAAKRKILQLYRADIAKFAPGYEDKVYAVFDQIPSQLSKKEKKYRLSQINKNARFRSYEDSFIWLNEAMITNSCFNTTDPNIGLALSADHSTCKCYMADTGLLVTLAFMDKKFADNELYKAVLFDKLNINEGMLMENIVAQMIRTNGKSLYYYSRSDKENRANHMEIDFLITRNNKISPIEVKSGNYRSHKSLDKFKAKFSSKIGEQFLLYTKDVMVKDGVTHLPLYMAMFL